MLVLLLLGSMQEGSSLIERLGDEEIAVRERASRDFRARLGEAEPLLRAGLQHSDAEVRARCADLLGELRVLRRPPPPAAIGKIAFVHERDRIVAIDRYRRDGVQVGEEFEVYRETERVGRLKVTDVQSWGSWARPCEGTDFSALRKGDRIAPPRSP